MKSEFHVAKWSIVPTSEYGQFSISTTACHDLFILSVRGDLDLMTVDQLRQSIDEALDSGAKSLVIDLTRTEFLAAVGLAALDYGRRKIETTGGRFAIVVRRRSTARLLKVLGLEQTLNMHRNVNDAMTACGRASHPLVTDAVGTHALTRPA